MRISCRLTRGRSSKNTFVQLFESFAETLMLRCQRLQVTDLEVRPKGRGEV